MAENNHWYLKVDENCSYRGWFLYLNWQLILKNKLSCEELKQPFAEPMSKCHKPRCQLFGSLNTLYHYLYGNVQMHSTAAQCNYNTCLFTFCLLVLWQPYSPCQLIIISTRPSSRLSLKGTCLNFIIIIFFPLRKRNKLLKIETFIHSTDWHGLARILMTNGVSVISVANQLGR